MIQFEELKEKRMKKNEQSLREMGGIINYDVMYNRGEINLKKNINPHILKA